MARTTIKQLETRLDVLERRVNSYRIWVGLLLALAVVLTFGAWRVLTQRRMLADQRLAIDQCGLAIAAQARRGEHGRQAVDRSGLALEHVRAAVERNRATIEANAASLAANAASLEASREVLDGRTAADAGVERNAAAIAGTRTAVAEVRHDLETMRARRTVGAEAFVLVDAGDRRCAALARDEDGQPGLWLYDEAGSARVRLGLEPDGGAGLDLLDADGSAAVRLEIGPGRRALTLAHEARAEAVWLGVSGHAAGLEIRDGGDQPRIGLAAYRGEAAGPGLLINDREGLLRAWLGVISRSATTVGPVGSETPPAPPPTSAPPRTERGAVMLFGEDGGPTWSAP